MVPCCCQSLRQRLQSLAAVADRITNEGGEQTICCGYAVEFEHSEALLQKCLPPWTRSIRSAQSEASRGRVFTAMWSRAKYCVALDPELTFGDATHMCKTCKASGNLHVDVDVIV